MAPFQLEIGPIPFYHQVYLDLRASIDDGRWQPGHRISPERDLAEQYGVSVITVRRALDELTREQRIERTRGRGTFVLPPRIDRDLDEPLTFTEEMQRRGLDPQTRLIAAREEPAVEVVAGNLQLEVGAPTVFFERLRLADGQPAPSRKGSPVGKALSWPARRRCRARIALCRARGAIRDGDRPDPRNLRAGVVAQARSIAAGDEEAPAGAARPGRRVFK